MKPTLIACCALFIAAGCGSTCPWTTSKSLLSSGSAQLQQGSVELADVSLGSSAALDDGYSLGAASSVIRIDETLVPIADPSNPPELGAWATPDLVFQALSRQPLTTLEGTELSVGQIFSSPGTFELTRCDLAGPSDETCPQEDVAAPFDFTITQYEKPVPSGDLDSDNWTTPPFLVLAFSSSAPTSLGTFTVSGTVSYTLDKSTFQEWCCDNLFGCE